MPIEIVARATDWTTNDQERWAEFLATETGKRLLPTLAETAPLLLPGGDINTILIRTGEVRGYQAVMRDLLALTQVEVKPTSEASSVSYPSLTDDSKWGDGQKLTPPAPDSTPTPE
jgi:hypothetical protein